MGSTCDRTWKEPYHFCDSCCFKISTSASIFKSVVKENRGKTEEVSDECIQICMEKIIKMMKYAIVLVMVLFFGTFVYADPAVDSDTIKGIQTALNAAGYECGEPDGIAGQKTADALSKYCSDKGISWDGTITDELIAKFNENETEIEVTQYDDKLKQIFVNLTFSTTEEDLLDWIDSYGLEYSAQKWNGTPKNMTYKIAFEDGVTAQRYADSGDHIEVSFNLEDGTFLYAEYCPVAGNRVVILFNYGTYWELIEKEPNNSRSGYYYKNLLGGGSGMDKYHLCKDADEALQHVG